MTVVSDDVPIQLLGQLGNEGEVTKGKISLHIISNHKCAHIASGATGDFDEEAIRV